MWVQLSGWTCTDGTGGNNHATHCTRASTHTTHCTCAESYDAFSSHRQGSQRKWNREST
jgi:hypothetical protein